MKTFAPRRTQTRGVTLKLSALTFVIAAVAGCGYTSKAPITVVPDPNLPQGLPIPPAVSSVNTYSGGQSPGAWTLTLDNTKDAFSYQPVTYPAPATTGGLQANTGFSSLGAGGLAYEVLGQAAVLRPGRSTASPVFGVPQTQCYAITGKVRFQYVEMFPGPAVTFQTSVSRFPLVYGSIVASTDSTGKNWQIENLQGNAVQGPASFNATCTAPNGQASISFPTKSLLTNFWATNNGTAYSGPGAATITANTQSNMWVSPSGFFAADQSDPTQTPGAGATVAGVIEPTAALSTSAVAAGEYLGFIYQAPSTYAYTPTSPTVALTAPAGFGQVVAGSGTTLTGGIFPGDNVAGTPNSDTELTLGSQDSQLNGLYSSASITVLDPAQNCANFSGSPSGFTLSKVTSGINAQGYITCTFPAVAVVGNPGGGKYAIFVTSYNWAYTFGGAAMNMFLFQQ